MHVLIKKITAICIISQVKKKKNYPASTSLAFSSITILIAWAHPTAKDML